MILEIQHETRLEYSQPVAESVTEVRMEPVTDSRQSCHSFHLAIRPHAEVFRYQDGLGNYVHHFNLLVAHSEVRILAASVVQTQPAGAEPLRSDATYPLPTDKLPLEALDFLKFRGPVRKSPRLLPVLNALQPQPGSNLADLVLRVSAYIREHFEYARNVTLASSPIDDLLQHGKGVCQDFTHLMIAVLRSFDVPARYVSGYIHRPNKDSQSHAWCEVWLPDREWCGIDPTNDCQVNDHFLKVAVGRDFTDVPPNKGIYRGRADESISVRVETRSLERLPSRTWQDRLPPLQVPLTAIVTRARPEQVGVDETPQQ